jgi:phosphatidylserine/phosphatidylglycerophosphate/cardiolipin synthase-like enzyme
MLRILSERAKAGVDVRIIGKLGSGKAGVTAEKYPGKRLHVRAIVRDGASVFIGSQSLRKLELDHRREVGVIVKNQSMAKAVAATFESDWARTGTKPAKPAEAKRQEQGGQEKGENVA